jgi:hypothetical protein
LYSLNHSITNRINRGLWPWIILTVNKKMLIGIKLRNLLGEVEENVFPFVNDI